jgi:hypothetical protein
LLSVGFAPDRRPIWGTQGWVETTNEFLGVLTPKGSRAMKSPPVRIDDEEIRIFVRAQLDSGPAERTIENGLGRCGQKPGTQACRRDRRTVWNLRRHERPGSQWSSKSIAVELTERMGDVTLVNRYCSLVTAVGVLVDTQVPTGSTWDRVASTFGTQRGCSRLQIGPDKEEVTFDGIDRRGTPVVAVRSEQSRD